MNRGRFFLIISIALNIVLCSVVIMFWVQSGKDHEMSDRTSNVECDIVQQSDREITFKEKVSSDEYGKNVYYIADSRFIYEFQVLSSSNDVDLNERLCIVVQYNTDTDVEEKNGDTYIYIRNLLDVQESEYPRDSL